MDPKVRETETLAEDGSAKKKFNFKSFKKFFGKKKRKEKPPDMGNTGLKQSQSAIDVTMQVSTDLDYDSEGEIEATAGVLGSRAVSHDSIFIPEKVQESDRPVRVFSQENVSDRIRALQAKLQSNIRVGPPPFGILTKRMDDAGASSEDDGLPRSPPEMYLIHEAVTARALLSPPSLNLYLIPFQFSDRPKHLSSLSLVGTGSEEDEQISGHSSKPLSAEANQLTNTRRMSLQIDDSISPSADFDTPAQFSTFLDNSAARHRLSVKPRNQRTSKNRRSSAVLLQESLVDLTSTMEELECDMDEAITTPTNITEKYKCMDGAETGTSNASSAQQVELVNQVTQNLEVKQNETVMEMQPQIPGAYVQLTSDIEELCSTFPSQGEDNKTLLNMKMEANVEKANDFYGASPSKMNDGAPRRLSTIGNSTSELVLDKSLSPKHDQSPKSFLTNKEKNLTIEHAHGIVNESSLVEELTVTRTKNDQSLQSTDSVQSHTRSSQSSTNVDLSQNEKSRSNQELSDKENNKLVGSDDKKVEKSSSDIVTQRKFSVSSAWERPKGGSFSLKGNMGDEIVKNMKFSVPKSAMPVTEKEKDDPRPQGTPTEGKTSIHKKDSFAHSKNVSADNPAVVPDAAQHNSMPDVSGSSVVVESHASSEEKNPFFVKLRSISMSLRYREGLAQEANRLKRHSAEVRPEKTGQMILYKDDCTEPQSMESHSKNENPKVKRNLSEQTNVRPVLPKKPVLQNITVADNNINKDTSACAPQQEKNVKPPEAKTEMNVFERRLSFQKQMEKGSLAEHAKGAEIKGQPPWISVALQKRLSFKEEQGLTESKSAVQEADKETADKDMTEAVFKNQCELVQNKTTNVTATGFPELHGQEIKAEVRTQRQRSHTLSHPIPATQSSLLTEKEEKNAIKRSTLSVSAEPSWMELAKKKSQAWNDMPQIIK